jgi:hypothetical protein
VAACTSGGRPSSPGGSSYGSYGSRACQRIPDAAAGHDRPVLVSHDRYWGHAEPDIAVNPRNPLDLLAASQVELGPRTRVPAAYLSTDGGRHWGDTKLLPLPVGYGQGADTTVAFGQDGTGYVAATVVPAAGGGFASRIRRGAVVVWRTADGGQSFASPVTVYQGITLEDHPWLAVDRAAGGPAGLLDIAWTDNAGLRFSQSRDGGRAFSTARVLIRSPAPIDPVVAITRSEVVVLYEELGARAITLHALRSADHGASFGSPVTIGAAPEAALPGAGQSKSAQFIPLFGAAASPASGALYAAISEFSRQVGHPRILIWASASDRAAWRGPVTLDDPATAARSQLQPRLAVSPGGTVSLLYFAGSSDGRITVNLAQTFGPARKFQAGRRLDTFCTGQGEWLGDYQGLLATSAATIAVWDGQPAGRLEIQFTILPARIPRRLKGVQDCGSARAVTAARWSPAVCPRSTGVRQSRREVLPEDRVERRARWYRRHGAGYPGGQQRHGPDDLPGRRAVRIALPGDFLLAHELVAGRVEDELKPVAVT